jgi:hypothetical protein
VGHQASRGSGLEVRVIADFRLPIADCHLLTVIDHSREKLLVNRQLTIGNRQREDS